MQKKALAIDIGGTSAKYGFVASDGSITEQNAFSTTVAGNFETFFQNLTDCVERAIAAGITQVGIACPGIFDGQGNSIGNIENLPYLLGKNLPNLLHEQYPNLTVTIGNDANAAAVGEYWLGAGKGSPCFLCMTLGTGIGGALIIDGKPHLGQHFQSCEIGYTNYQSQQDYYEKDSSTNGALRVLGARLGQENVSGKVFVQKVVEGAPIYTEVFEEWMDRLGQLLANIILVIDPERVVVGGGISSEKTLLVPALTAAIDAHLPAPFRGKSKLMMAECGNDAGLLGAVYGFFKEEI